VPTTVVRPISVRWPPQTRRFPNRQPISSASREEGVFGVALLGSAADVRVR